METRRFALIAVLGVLVFMLYQAWQADYGKKPTEPQTVATTASTTASGTTTTASTDAPATPAIPGGNSAPNPAPAATTIHVHTDVFDAEIATTGAELRRVVLLQYPVDKHRPDEKLALLDDRDTNHWFTLQSGLLTANKALYANNATAYSAPQPEYRLAEGADALEVPLTATLDGLTVTKTYRFRRGSYQAELVQTVANHSGAAQTVNAYARWERTPHAAGIEAPFVHSFLGLGIYEQKPGTDAYRFNKITLDKLDKTPYEIKQTGGWIAMLQHYFVAAIVPPAAEKTSYSGRPAGNGQPGYFGEYIGDGHAVADGAQASFPVTLYIGPKSQGTLDAVAPGLELVQNYGIWTPIAGPLFWGLKEFHALTGNWGWAIVLLTIVVKGLTYPLSAAQYKSMAKMKKFGPRLTELKERYADDREKLNKAMMELYKKEGFNPLAGCWPILVTLPIFYSLYSVMMESVELRQAPFMLWWNDLSGPDPYYVLPVLYGFTMWLQQRISGQTATMDPTQAKIMNVMPIAMTGLFLFFPQGLVLYWFVSNTVGILQQLVIIRRQNASATK